MTDDERALLVLIAGWLARTEEGLAKDLGRTSAIAREARDLIERVERAETRDDTARPPNVETMMRNLGSSWGLTDEQMEASRPDKDDLARAAKDGRHE
jgi:hypothetical protein